MRRISLLILVAVLLCGCKAEPAWETVEDMVPVEAVPAARQLYVLLPEDASQPTLQAILSGCCPYEVIPVLSVLLCLYQLDPVAA